MPTYFGVTTQLDRMRKQHTTGKRNLRKWVVANGGAPFASRQAAQTWLKTQSGEHDPMAGSAAGQWYGYSFDYDVGAPR
ncbi:MAG: hypothetical protein ABIJ09_06055 [Pseudomonadota bacterium]